MYTGSLFSLGSDTLILNMENVGSYSLFVKVESSRANISTVSKLSWTVCEEDPWATEATQDEVVLPFYGPNAQFDLTEDRFGFQPKTSFCGPKTFTLLS